MIMTKPTSSQPIVSGTGAINTRKSLSETLFFIRGLAIFSVVVGHVIGDRTAGIRQLYLPDLWQLRDLHDFIYSFHIPIFFILSGAAFILFSSSTSSFFSFAKNRANRLLIPLLCWAPLHSLLWYFEAGRPFSWPESLTAIFSPNLIFWLWQLFLVSIVSYLALRILPTSIYFALSILLFGLSFWLKDSLADFFYFNWFYVSGILIGWRINHRTTLPLVRFSPLWLLAAAGLIFVGMVAIYFYTPVAYPNITRAINGAIGFLGMYCIAIFSHLITAHRSRNRLHNLLVSIRRFILHLGKLSMTIYVMHGFFSTAARVVLMEWNITEPSIQLAFGILIATLGPLAVDALLRPRSRLYLYTIGEASN
nr:MAG: acyltransferase [Leptolyngbya sp. IPPAS B-1204]